MNPVRNRPELGMTALTAGVCSRLHCPRALVKAQVQISNRSIRLQSRRRAPRELESVAAGLAASRIRTSSLTAVGAYKAEIGGREPRQASRRAMKMR